MPTKGTTHDILWKSVPLRYAFSLGQHRTKLVRCCLYPENAPEKTLSSIVPHFSGVVNILPQLCRICDFDHCVPQKIAATNLPIRETEKLVKELYIELFHQL